MLTFHSAHIQESEAVDVTITTRATSHPDGVHTASEVQPSTAADTETADTHAHDEGAEAQEASASVAKPGVNVVCVM